MSSTFFRVTVPASTSNLGSGFDTISAALSLSLTVDVELTSGDKIDWVEGWDLPARDNILDRSLRTALATLGGKPAGIRVVMDNPIPLKRGLGSSGAAIIAGIKIAEQLCQVVLSPDQVFEVAYPLEGHPDNLSASLLGGWVLSRISRGKMRAERLPSLLSCRFVLAIPEVTISTREARSILPDRYPLEDATHNLQRCALLVHALTSGRKELLREATEDRLHQSYRSRLVPGLQKLLSSEGLREELSRSLLGISISGSGSAVTALADGHYHMIGEWMVQTLSAEGTPAIYKILDLDTKGAQVTASP